MTGRLEHRVAGDRAHAWTLASHGDEIARLEWRQDVDARARTGWYLVRSGDAETFLAVDPAVDALARDLGRDPETWVADADLLAHLTTGAALDAAERRLLAGTGRGHGRDLVGGAQRQYRIRVRGLAVDALALAFPSLAADREGGDVVLSGTLGFAELTAVVSRVRTLGGVLVSVLEASAGDDRGIDAHTTE